MQTELDAALVSHKSVQQSKDHAKTELALVEQQLLNDRAARNDQLQQHSSLVSL
jgi:exonuclease VII small subunit